jgi:8-oxo-dGTP pyrophosphatase MutT (NUDIX family)
MVAAPVETNWFLSAVDVNPDKFGKKIVARNIILKLGKNDDDTKVLLHERPKWAGIQPLNIQFYGGQKNPDETIRETAQRELKEELRWRKEHPEFIGASEYGGWLNYYFLIRRKIARSVRDKSGQTHVKDDPTGPPLKNGWYTIKEINHPDFPIAFNHREVINQLVAMLRSREKQ